MTSLFIAEVKTRSPFGFESPHGVGYLTELACRHGDAVAAHTDGRWGGSFDHLRSTATLAHMCGKLVLAKGVHAEDDDIRRALQCGADLVLVVGRRPPPELVPVCLIEPQDAVIAYGRGDRLVINSRDLSTGERVRSFADARTVDERRWMCQASFIRTRGDVHLMADAFIVGEHLPEFCRC